MKTFFSLLLVNLSALLLWWAATLDEEPVRRYMLAVMGELKAHHG